MTSELHGSSIDAYWFGAAYLLTCAIFQPLVASASDIFGRKDTVLVSVCLFLLGTYISAPLAQEFILVIVGRTIQGIGSAGIISMNQIIFAGTVSLRVRPAVFYISIGMWALGSILGPLTAGVFVEKLSWRYCFYINVRVNIFFKAREGNRIVTNLDMIVHALRPGILCRSRLCEVATG